MACKRATSPAAAARVRAEADRLGRLDHPGVVRLVELREGPDGPVLVTDYVGPRSIDSAGAVAAERAARLVAHLAGTLADLHAAGTLHGRVAPEHVLVAGDATVLCGPAVDPEHHHPADDVAGAGRCLLALLAPEVEAEPIPDRRPWGRHRWQGYRHRSLLTLADLATADDPGRRPSARAFADAVAALAGPRGPAADRPTPDTPTAGRAVVDRLALWLRPPRRRATAASAGLLADAPADVTPREPAPGPVTPAPPPAPVPDRRPAPTAAVATGAPLVVELDPEPPPHRLVVDLEPSPTRPSTGR